MSLSQNFLKMGAVMLPLAAALPGCASTISSDVPAGTVLDSGVVIAQKTTVVHGSHGGGTKKTLDWYNEKISEGNSFVLDGDAVSADAFLFAIMFKEHPGLACYTPKAKLSMHAASYGGIIPAIENTEILKGRMPEKLRTAFEASGHDINPITGVVFDYKDLVGIIPEHACDQDFGSGMEVYEGLQSRRQHLEPRA